MHTSMKMCRVCEIHVVALTYRVSRASSLANRQLVVAVVFSKIQRWIAVESFSYEVL